VARWVRRVAFALLGGALFGCIVVLAARYLPTFRNDPGNGSTSSWHEGFAVGAIAACAVAGLILFAFARGIPGAKILRDDEDTR
jgi:hypothetical protein